MSELTNEFDRAMWEIYNRAKNECHYDANRFKQMLCDHGGVDTAVRLLDAPVRAGVVQVGVRVRCVVYRR